MFNCVNIIFLLSPAINRKTRTADTEPNLCLLVFCEGAWLQRYKGTSDKRPTVVDKEKHGEENGIIKKKKEPRNFDQFEIHVHNKDKKTK